MKKSVTIVLLLSCNGNALAMDNSAFFDIDQIWKAHSASSGFNPHNHLMCDISLTIRRKRPEDFARFDETCSGGNSLGILLFLSCAPTSFEASDRDLATSFFAFRAGSV